MATLFLLQFNLKPNIVTNHYKAHIPLNKTIFIPKNLTQKHSKTILKSHSPFQQTNKYPTHILSTTLLKTLSFVQKAAITAFLFGLLFFYDTNTAFARSGGRIGGNSFSSSSSRSYKSSSRMSSNNGHISVPYYAPSPFGFSGDGFYVGPAVGVGVGAAGSSFFFVFMGFVAFLVVSGFLSDRSEGGDVLTATGKTSVLKLQVGPAAVVRVGAAGLSFFFVFMEFFVFSGFLSDRSQGGGVLTATCKTSELKLQVGLLGLARSLQKDLNRIAETADTSTKEGLTYILTEATLSLLRHPDYCISGFSSVDVKNNMEDGEKRFNRLSIEERGKFDEETLVNVNNIKKQSTSSRKSTRFNNEYIVITILVAAEGVHKLPTISSSEDLKEALKKLGSIPANKTLAVEVLWTPQNEDDTLTERELLEDYALLRPL